CCRVLLLAGLARAVGHALGRDHRRAGAGDRDRLRVGSLPVCRVVESRGGHRAGRLRNAPGWPSAHRMKTRTLLAIALDIALAAVSVFYLFAATVYTFFSEAQLSYSKSPRWFASTAPARMTAQFFDRYNASAPRAARFQRQLSCFLADEGGAARRAG